MNKKLNIRLLDSRLDRPDLRPSYSTEGAAGFDLRACIQDSLVLQPNQSAMIKTGVAIQLDNPGILGLLTPHTGFKPKLGILLANGSAMIDAENQEEIELFVWNLGDVTQVIKPMEKISQLRILTTIQVGLSLVDAF